VLRVALLALVVPSVAFAQPSTAPVEQTTRINEGLTFDVSAGLGWIRSSPTASASFTTGVSLALSAGAGLWLTPRLVLGGRFAGVSNFESSERLGAYVIGPSAQFWLDKRFWVGGGVGLGVLASTTSANDIGFGLDLRAGLTFSETDDYAFSGSFEVTPARFSSNGESATLTGFALVVCMQSR
jgi:hypothetical protein